METPTLHDFVLKLLVDPEARTAFELDPEGVLTDAGLGDITAADVQEVIPLVVDYAPIDGLTDVVAVDEPALGLLDGDASGAVAQLTAITQQLGVTGSNDTFVNTSVNASAGLGVSVGLGEIPLGVGAGAGADSTLALGVDVPLLADPAQTLDVVDPVLGVTDPVVDTVDPVLGTVDPVVGGVTGPVTDGALDPILGGVYGTVDVTVGTVVGLEPVAGTVDSLGLGGLTGTGTDPASGLLDPVTGTVTDTVGTTVSGLTGDLTGNLLGGGRPATPEHGDSDGLLDLLH